MSVQVAVEVDKVASRTYKYNNEEVELLVDDILNITGDDLLSKINLTPDDKLLLVACPPCQGFSTIGTNDTNDARNQLIFEYLRLIKEINPDFLLMENVSGIAREKNKIIFHKFLEGIKEDYHFSYGILNAADFGVPQLRKRLVLHGVKKSIVFENFRISLPEQTHSKSGIGDLKKWVNADIIMDLPQIVDGEEYIGNGIYNHIANKLSDINIERIQYIRNGGGSRSCLPEYLRLKCHAGNNGHGDVYGILDISKPSITMTGGCMSYSKGRFGHPTQDRALSAREAARLQSFDDDYVFIGNRAQLARQIGNAVPVKLAEASGKYFQKILNEVYSNERDYKNIR
ncbi:DNA cytosine methyltransferase [Streptococcus sp. WM07]|uniref:DNA cytosine methyltransferase n=1 Tax=unclassified Streptococcus TaxID=2608887 RepID=UPI001FD7FED0|nr:DNA cytosine methyltransferase [Streptococcus sp. WM07]